jgi:hypothetical protein
MIMIALVLKHGHRNADGEVEYVIDGLDLALAAANVAAVTPLPDGSWGIRVREGVLQPDHGTSPEGPN